MKLIVRALAIFLSLLTAGCGTATPSFEEFWAVDPNNTRQKVVNVAAQVSCELQQAIKQLIDQDKYIAAHSSQKRKVEWLEKWGVLVTLTLNVVEKTDLTPGLNVNRLLPSATSIVGGQSITTPQSFTFGLSGEYSATATRNGIVHMFYTVDDLLKYPSEGTTCVPAHPAPGFMFIESNIGLKEWIYASVSPAFLDLAYFPATKDKGPLGQDALSQEFKFEIVSNAGVNPSWKLVNFTGNTSPSLISGSRDRYQDLIVTLGPLDTTLSGKTVLSPAAQELHQAQQFGFFTSAGIQH